MDHPQNPRRSFALSACTAIAASLLCGCTAMETVPETGRRRPVLQYTEAQMDEFGSEAYKEVLAKYQVISTGRDAEMVQHVGSKIAKVTGKDYAWEFKLLKAPDNANAFCLPGGKVAVFSGIMPLCQGPNGLAVVLSHEIAHATLEHGNERLSQPTWKKLVNIPVGTVTGLWGAIAPGTRKFVMDGLGVGVLVNQVTPYNQVQESEADEVGLKYMYEAGYNVDEAPKFWKRMGEHSGPQIADSLSSHPATEKRISALEQEVKDIHAREATMGKGNAFKGKYQDVY